MAITDELREYVNQTPVPKSRKLIEARDRFNAIADRIDAAHERLCSRSRSNGYGDGFTDGFNDIESWVVDHEDEMAEHGWVRLPVDGEAPCKQLGEWIEKRGLITGPLDRDGELWHGGDMSDSNWGEIEGIVYENGKWFIRGHDTSAPWIPADSIGHHHAPTVEDVLREMLDAWGEMPSNMTNEAIVAEYAAKLRLAGGDK